jgi:nucleoside phosphorylase
MRVLVTFAVDAEFAPWHKLRNFKKTTLGGNSRISSPPGFTADIKGNRVQVLLTGIGHKTCEESLATFDFDRGERPDLVISSGLAGALREEFKPGDMVVPQRVRTLNNDADGTADAIFLDRAVLAGGIRIETLITAKQLVQTADEKRRLAFFGEAVDMESAYILAKCARASVPCMSIRSISDAADEDLPIDFDRCLTPQGAVKPMNLVNTIVQRPSRLPKLIRFGRQSIQATHKLVEFLDSFVAALPRVEVESR